MMCKVIQAGEKEKPKKKYCGLFKNVSAVYPVSGLRLIHIVKDNGKHAHLFAYFKTLLREENNVKLGDRVEIDYYDYRNFTMKKLEGKKK